MDRSDKLKKRINTAIAAMKGFCISLIADIAAFIVFAAVCAGLDLKQNDPNAVLLGVSVLGIISIAFIICMFISLLYAKILYKRLKELPADDSE